MAIRNNIFENELSDMIDIMRDYFSNWFFYRQVSHKKVPFITSCPSSMKCFWQFSQTTLKKILDVSSPGEVGMICQAIFNASAVKLTQRKTIPPTAVVLMEA